jgi:hypothetical protein
MNRIFENEKRVVDFSIKKSQNLLAIYFIDSKAYLPLMKHVRSTAHFYTIQGETATGML